MLPQKIQIFLWKFYVSTLLYKSTTRKDEVHEKNNNFLEEGPFIMIVILHTTCESSELLFWQILITAFTCKWQIIMHTLNMHVSCYFLIPLITALVTFGELLWVVFYHVFLQDAPRGCWETTIVAFVGPFLSHYYAQFPACAFQF